MGGGASAVRDMEEIVACTFLIGKAIAAVNFPDMYNLYDFKAKPTDEEGPFLTQRIGDDGKVTYVIMSGDRQAAAPTSSLANGEGGGSGSSEGEEEGNTDSTKSGEGTASPQDAQENDSGLTVNVNGDTIVLKEPNKANDDGWTPLHACCHSSSTVRAGLAIIQWVLEQGGSGRDLDGKTKRGPGAFNAGWTPLHMASAYGVEALVDSLVSAGADVNTKNTLTWTPLQEACHRGFLSIIRLLIRGGADVNNVPDDRAARNSPFLRAPAQSPLGEVCRCGFKEAAKVLLDAGADKNRRNALGWTPLHEAAFFNHADVVQMLLVYGADATVRNNQGALPYHLAALPELRTIIRELGGEGAVADPLPNPLLKLLKSDDGASSAAKPPATAAGMDAPGKPDKTLRTQASSKVEAEEEEGESGAGGGQSPFLHRGEMLGDLPALGSTQPAKTRPQEESHRRKPGLSKKPSLPSKKAEDKNARGELPKEFLCELCLRPLRHPVRTPYGNVYERDVITTWAARNGSIDPLTGQPLALSELKPDTELAARIKEYHKAARGQDEGSQEGDKDGEDKVEGEPDQGKASKGKNSEAQSGVLQRGTSSLATASAPRAVNDDDLYDF